MEINNKGKVVSVNEAVIEVEFITEPRPRVRDVLVLERDPSIKMQVMKSATDTGFYCIALANIRSIKRGDVVVNTSDGLRIPVGPEILGRVMNIFGEPKDGKMNYSLVEGLLLLEKGRMDITDDKDRKLGFDEFVKRARLAEPNFWIRYCVFKDLRSRGYIVKTALKFGADFRVYDRGVKPGDDHAKWIVFPVHETENFSWHEFSAKNRVAHSTRKSLLIAIVDEESDVTYYTCQWIRP